MRLYSFITADMKVNKRQGANEGLDISITHETAKGSWQTNMEEVGIAVRWNNGKPTLTLDLPKSWKQNKEWNNGDFYRFEYQGE